MIQNQFNKQIWSFQAAALESEGGNNDVADQLISVPFTSYLRTYSCSLCSAQFIGISEETLRVHFKKVIFEVEIVDVLLHKVPPNCHL
jgi:hypothetical protein